MEKSLMLKLADQFETMATTIRRHYELSGTPPGRTWNADVAEEFARRVKPDLGTAQAFAIRELAKAYPGGLPASALAVNPNSMPNAYDLLDNKLGPLGLVRCDDGYPRKYYLGPVFERPDSEDHE